MAPRGGPGLLFDSILEAIGGTFGTLELFWAVFFQVQFWVEIRTPSVVIRGRKWCHGGGAGGPTIPKEGVERTSGGNLKRLRQSSGLARRIQCASAVPTTVLSKRTLTLPLAA